MADDNKQAANSNTNDDLNLDFDIVLDQNAEITKPEEIKPNLKNNKQSDFDLNFDLDSSTEIKKEVPIIQEEKPKEEILEQAKIEIVKEPDTKYNPDLNAANETIQQLQEAKQQGKQTIVSDKLNDIPTTQTIDAKIIQQETQTTNTVPIGAINLDEILPTSEIKTPSPIQDIPQVQFPQSVQKSLNPYDIAPQTPTKVNTAGNKKHLIMVIGIVAACLIAGFFILKTMYPMQFGSSNGGSGNNIDTTTPQDPNPFQDTTPTEEIIFTGETGTDQNINEFTGNIIDLSSGNVTDINSGNITDLSGNIQDHNITDQGDPFQALDNLQTTDEQKKQATIDSLKEFVTKGQYYLDLGKQNSITDMIKYGTFLTVKSSKFINQIENGEILDISSLDGYLAQSSGYLQKLQELENAPNTTTPQSQENTGFLQNQTGTQDNGGTGINTQL